MKLDAFLFINGLYLLFTVPVFALIYFIFRFLLKREIYFVSDLLFLGGGVFYYLLDLVNERLKFVSFKNMGNTITELILISSGYCLLFFIRSMIGKINPNSSKVYSLIAIPLYVIVSSLVFFIIPTISE